MEEGFVNTSGAVASLAANVTAEATSISVNKAAPEGVWGKQFRVRIGTELMLVTATGAKGASPWTVTRDAETLVGGSGPVAHVSGSKVYIELTTGALATKADLEGGTLAASQLPSSVASSSDGSTFPRSEVAGIADRQVSRYNSGTGHFIYKDPYFVDPMDFGAAVGGTYHAPPADGGSHPLSTIFSTLAEAQATYPFVTALTQERDWAAVQAAYNALPKGEVKNLQPAGEGVEPKYVINAGGRVKWGFRKYVIGTTSVKLKNGSKTDLTNTTVEYTGTGDLFIRDEEGPSTTPYTFWRCDIEGGVLCSTYTKAEPESGGRHAINILRVSDSMFTDILIYGFREESLVLPEAQWNTFTKVNALYNGGYGVRVGDSVALETELTAEVNESAETLPVAATVTVTSGLEARIGSYYGEQVSYTGKTTKSLTGCKRGLYGSRSRSWPAGTKVYIMSNQRSNNNAFVNCRFELNGQGGIFCDFGHANTWSSTCTAQFSGRETTLTEALVVPGNLHERGEIKVASTEGFAPVWGWGMLTKGAESEIFTYEYKTATAFHGVMRGMKGSTAAAHTTAGTAVRQGVGVHFRGHDNFRSVFEGHLEGNTWHSFVEADEIQAEAERGCPRGTEIRAFFVASNKVERYLVNQGEGTLVGGSSQSNLEENLSRNGTKVPFEIYQTSTFRNATITFISGPLTTAPANLPLLTDQTGLVDTTEAYKGQGMYVGGPLVLGRYNEPTIYVRLNNGTTQTFLRMAAESLLQLGNAILPLLLRASKLEFGSGSVIKATNNSTKLQAINCGWQGPNINTTSKTSAEITTAYEAAIGSKPEAGATITDQTNHLLLTFSGVKWFKSAAYAEVV